MERGRDTGIVTGRGQDSLLVPVEDLQMVLQCILRDERIVAFGAPSRRRSLFRSRYMCWVVGVVYTLVGLQTSFKMKDVSTSWMRTPETCFS